MACPLLLLPLLSSCLLLLASAAPDPSAPIEGVMDLTTDSFSVNVGKDRGVFVEFYADWCGHCKSLTPEMKKLAKMLQADNRAKNFAMIGKVNADKHRTLAELFKVEGFPTLKYFPSGPGRAPISFEGSRKAGAMLKFIKEQIEAEAKLYMIPQFDEILEGYMAAEDKDAVAGQIFEALDGLMPVQHEDAQLYLEMLKKGREKGPEYFASEKARIEKILDNGSVHPSKAYDMLRKSAVLSRFLGEERASSTEEGKREGEEDAQDAGTPPPPGHDEL